MNNLTYKEILLSFPQYILLVKVKFCGIGYDACNKERRRFLRQYRLVELDPHSGSRFRISDNGKMYLRYRSRSFWKFMIPTVISIIALFGGYDVYTNPLLKEILEAIASLFGRIAESLGAFLKTVF